MCRSCFVLSYNFIFPCGRRSWRGRTKSSAYGSSRPWTSAGGVPATYPLRHHTNSFAWIAPEQHGQSAKLDGDVRDPALNQYFNTSFFSQPPAPPGFTRQCMRPACPTSARRSLFKPAAFPADQKPGSAGRRANLQSAQSSQTFSINTTSTSALRTRRFGTAVLV